MTRYINLCREPAKPPPDDKTAPLPEQTKYEKYKQSYENYRNLDYRKEFHKNYNKNYRQEHSFEVLCECGITHKDISKYAHQKSKRHITFLQNKNKAD